MPLDIRLVNMTAEPIEIDDGLGGKLTLPPGRAVPFPGEIAGPELRRLLRIGHVMIEDEPAGEEPVEHE